MSLIKKFFEKKKIEQKFKKAGEGRTLAGSSAGAGSQQKPKKVELKSGGARQQPSDCAQRAGAAALARLEADEFKNRAPNWSLSAIRNQAKKEIEQEQQMAAQGNRPGPKEVFQECAPVLSVNGVYFTCALIGNEILPKNEMREKIKTFLYEQMIDEKALTACLLIHTCNLDKEKVKIGIETISKYLRNIIDNPSEEKYRKIRLNNKVFKDRVEPLEGAMDFLLGAGFECRSLETGATGEQEEYLVFPDSNLDSVDYLGTLTEALLNAEPIVPQLDRNLKVLMPSQALARVTLPSDFFNISVDELKREQERKSAEVEVNSQLRTKAMRERDTIRELRKYRYSLMRIRFPDGIILQGTFSVNEPFYKVSEYVSDNLEDPGREFQLLAPGGERLREEDINSSLKELHLVPAALLTLEWEDGNNSKGNLNHEVMALIENIGS